MRSMIAVVLMVCATAAVAQTVPKSNGDPLEEICSGFMTQNNLRVSGSAAKLCTCLVREVKGQLSRAEMEAYDKANASAQPLPPRLQEKVSGIAVQCLTEAN